MGSGDCKKEQMAIGGALFDIAFDHTGKKMVVCADVAKGIANRVFMWESGTAQGDLAGNSKRVITCDIRPESPSRLAVGGEDFIVKLHNGAPYKFAHNFTKHKNYVQCVRYSPDGKYLATAGSDKKIFILDAESGELAFELPEKHKGSIYSVSWSDDAKKLLSCSGDKSVCLWDIDAKNLISQIALGKSIDDMQMGCAMAGSKAVSVSLSGDISFLDFDAGKIGSIVESHTSTPLFLTRDWSNDKPEVYIGSHDGGVFCYNSNGCINKLQNGGKGKSDGVVVNKGQLWSCGHDDTLHGAKVGDGKLEFTSSCVIGSQPTGLASSAGDPGLCVIITTENDLMLFRDGKKVDSKPLKKIPTAVSISTDGTECIVGCNDKCAYVYSISNDSFTDSEKKMGPFTGIPSAIEYSPEGSIAFAVNVKDIHLYDANHNLLHDKFWVYHTGKINSMKFSANGKYLVSCGLDGQIIVWNTSSKMKKTKMEHAHAFGVNDIVWLDDKNLLSAGNDCCLRKWAPKLP